MIVWDCKKFREERIRQKISYRDLARELKKWVPTAKHSTVESWEKKSTPHLIYALAIAKALNKPIEFFLKEVKSRKALRKKSREKKTP